MLVDDDDITREIVAELLDDLGYEVVAAATAASAYNIVRTGQKIDLVVSDVVMPGTDGVTLAGQLRSFKPNLPVVFITGYPADHDLSDEIVLAKPFTRMALQHVVSGVLGRMP